MARHDYSEDEDFYSQGFEKKGVISIWIGLKDRHLDKNIDTLQDLCGVGYYKLSDQESNTLDYEPEDISRLLTDLSYSSSYAESVISEAKKRGIQRARRVIVQYDFAYDPARVVREIDSDPVFLGVFAYRDDE